jgi:predicted nucleic acid-binding protein
MVVNDLLFLDANYVVGLEVSDDQHHHDARQHWTKYLESPRPLVTTSYVFDEVVTFLNNKRQHAKAVSVGSNLLTASTIQMIHVDESLFYEGWQYFEQHADKTYSLTDCISFVLMTRLGIVEALTFDKHFLQAGFVKLP